VSDWDQVLRRLRRAYARYRRVAAAGSAAVAVMLVVRVVSPPPPESVPVVVTAHDVSGGTTLKPGDVRIARMPPALVPSGSLSAPSDAVGEALAAPMRAGEALTDRRVLGRSLVAGYAPGLVGAPVRISDPDVVSLLQAGDSIDLYAATAARRPASLIAASARVVMLPRVAADSQRGGLVVLAVPSSTAARIAAAGAISPISVTLH
jgi:Flp pilus assembly protein CpaB